MITTMRWAEVDGKTPIVEVDHRTYEKEHVKSVTFRIGCSVIEIKTDEDGLKRIADALGAHPEEMRRQARNEFEKAKAVLIAAGADVPSDDADAIKGEQ